MSEQTEPTAQQEEPLELNSTDEQAENVDWEAKYKEAIAHSRKWEKRANANSKAQEELDKLKKSQMSEIERATAERDEYKALAESLQAEKERASWVSEVSKETKVPTDLLGMISAENKEDLLEKAKSLADRFANSNGGVPVVLGDGTHAKENTSVSANDFFRAKFQNMNH